MNRSVAALDAPGSGVESWHVPNQWSIGEDQQIRGGSLVVRRSDPVETRFLLQRPTQAGELGTYALVFGFNYAGRKERAVDRKGESLLNDGRSVRVGWPVGIGRWHHRQRHRLAEGSGFWLGCTYLCVRPDLSILLRTGKRRGAQILLARTHVWKSKRRLNFE